MSSLDREPERAELLAFLDAQRRSVLAIVEGLDEHASAQSVVPSGWTPRGLIVHLAQAEYFWFERVMAGRAGPPSDETGEDPPSAPGASPLGEVIAAYRDQCARSDSVLASTSLHAAPAAPVPADMPAEVHNVRTIVLHMIEETARHAGHLDIARELTDGRTGLGPR